MPEPNNYPVWPGWETVRIIGRGSFGTVYEITRDIYGHQERAAMKVISIPQSDSDIEELLDSGYTRENVTDTFKEHMQDILREYSLMREMNGSANVVNCDDVRIVQHDDGVGWDIFIRMELLTPLTKALVKEASEKQVIRIGQDMCRALMLCKKHDIIHRDIKPQNIFLSPNGDYKLGDFGIAKTVEKTSGGTKIGTYKYMAPEVYNNQPYNLTADIYSLGLVLYWLLNARRSPFVSLPPAPTSAREEEMARVRRFRGEALPPPHNGSEGLKQVVLKACAYDPKERFQSAEEMLDSLDRLARSASSPRPVSPPAQRPASAPGERPAAVPAQKEPAQPSPASSPAPVQNPAPARRPGPVSVQKIVTEPPREPAPAAAPSAGSGPAVSAPAAKRPKWLLPLIGLLAALAALALFLLPKNDSSDADDRSAPAAEEPAGHWVILNHTNYYKGELSYTSNYGYDNHGVSEINSVFYNYDGSESHQRTTYEKDADGRFLKYSVYDSDTNELLRYTEYLRDQDGELQRLNTYEADGTLSQSQVPHKKGERTEEIYSYENGKTYMSALWEYNENDQPIKYTYYNSDGSTSSVSEYTYDENQRQKSYTFFYYFSGTLQNKSETVYEYDDSGRQIRDVETDLGTGKVTVGTYTYDEHGNELMYVSVCDGEEISRSVSEYGYYLDGVLTGEISRLSADGTRSAPAALTSGTAEGQRIVVHRGWVLGLTDEGTVLAAGGDNSFGSNMVVTWSDIAAIDAAVNGSSKTVVGLKRDGTVEAVGWNISGECDVSDWKDVVQVEAVISNTYALRSDGTMLATGHNSSGENNVGGITGGAGLYMLEHSSNGVFVVDKNGNLNAAGDYSKFRNSDFNRFKNISSLCLNWSDILAVTKDGKVISLENQNSELSGWTNIRKVVTGYLNSNLVVGIRNDGTVTACALSDRNGEAEAVKAVSSWTNIKDILVLSAYSDYKEYTVIGVKNDGSLVSVGSLDLSGFDNIRELYAYDDSYNKFAYLVGVRNDGTVVSNDPLVADTVAQWKLF